MSSTLRDVEPAVGTPHVIIKHSSEDLTYIENHESTTSFLYFPEGYGASGLIAKVCRVSGRVGLSAADEASGSPTQE
ncbi:hypothetical protein Van01_03460 [Micromonospora andamanensis]|uniref:Uncharacterized protein n=1 Tax=Micromonospora andamanensis TaxID=1287068 RepID=A0ABQ4HNA8_9ACTN|nr:hypothetical protein Van01_03460 [Micromonospora andamanensis]